MKPTIQGVVLAAGKATRFRSHKSKLLEPLCGRPMIVYVTDLLQSSNIQTTYVVGYQAHTVQQTIESSLTDHDTHATFVLQEEQKGTGHALLISQPTWTGDHILVMNGDMPLITRETLNQLIEHHLIAQASATFVIAHNADPDQKGYGRIVKQNNSIKIVEAKDFSGDLNEHCCINAGIYIFERKFLEHHINALTQNNAAHEFYITDLIQIASDNNLRVETVTTSFDQIRGVNTFKELWAAEQIKRGELISNHLDHGVRFGSPHTVHIDIDITIGAGTTIGSGVRIEQGTHIGSNCVIEPLVILDNATIEDNCTVYSHSIIRNAVVKKNAHIGPFAHIHEGTIIETGSIIGNFVEIKRSTFGAESKAKHHAYISDTTVGKKVNIGAGTITCNYDGTSKHHTTIEDEAFIGSNNTIIAPITIGKKAYTAGGSIINQNVPDNALAIGRAHQVNKLDYAKKIKEKSHGAKHTLPLDDDQDQDEYSFIAALKDRSHTTADES
jgi:bifunctional UDP-N-acetylglucosamine pyrophosphorylase/glucosamine-1-phosphate N-acetyltransferase